MTSDVSTPAPRATTARPIARRARSRGTSALRSAREVRHPRRARQRPLRRDARHQRRHARRVRPRRHGDHRPVGLRQEHAAPRLQPHERPDRAARAVEGRVEMDGVDILAPRRRRRQAAAPHRHGVPEAQPVPDERSTTTSPTARAQHGVRGKSRLDEIVERSLRRAALWDEVQDRLKQAGARPLRRAAAAPLHRPRAGGRAQRHPHGRAVQRPRPASPR